MLEIDRLTFSYDGGDTGFAFDMRIGPGEIAGLVGPSGAGKSTLFDLIAGFLEPISGDIALSGRSILGQPPEDRPVSILFQSDNLFDHLSTGANVALGLGSAARATDERVTEALAQMGLSAMIGRRAAQLSRWPAPFCATGPSCCSMNPLPAWTTKRPPPSAILSGIWCAPTIGTPSWFPISPKT